MSNREVRESLERAQRLFRDRPVSSQEERLGDGRLAGRSRLRDQWPGRPKDCYGYGEAHGWRRFRPEPWLAIARVPGVLHGYRNCHAGGIAGN